MQKLRFHCFGEQLNATISLVCVPCCAQPQVGFCIVPVVVRKHHGGHFVDQAVQRCATALCQRTKAIVLVVRQADGKCANEFSSFKKLLRRGDSTFWGGELAVADMAEVAR